MDLVQISLLLVTSPTLFYFRLCHGGHNQTVRYSSLLDVDQADLVDATVALSRYSSTFFLFLWASWLIRGHVRLDFFENK